MSTEPPEKKSPWQHVKSWPLSAKIVTAVMAAVLLLVVGGVIGAGSSGLSADGESGNEEACKLSVGHYATMMEASHAGNTEGTLDASEDFPDVLDDALDEATGEIRGALGNAQDAAPSLSLGGDEDARLAFFLAMDRVDKLCEDEAGVSIDVPQG